MCMFVIPIFIEAGITGFESPVAEYVELGISIDELIIKHPNATFIGIASGQSMQEVGIFDGDLLVIDRAEDVSTGDIIVASYNGSFVEIIDKSNAYLSLPLKIINLFISLMMMTLSSKASLLRASAYTEIKLR